MAKANRDKYFDLIKLSLFSLTISFLLVQLLIPKWLELYSKIDNGYTVSVLVIFLFSVMILLLKNNYALNYARIFRDLFNYRYPAIWLVGILNSFILIWIYSILNISVISISEVGSFVYVLLFPLITFGLGFIYTLLPHKNINSPTISDIQLNITPEKIFKWLNDERAIETYEQDLIDYNYMVKKLAAKITQNSFKSMLIKGEYGIGKSSIINLTKKFINNNYFQMDDKSSHLIFCEFRGWGKVENPDKFLLESAIKELSKIFDCSGLISVPQSYKQAITSVNKYGAGLFDLFDSFLKPSDILKKLNDAITINNCKVIFIIEDIERVDSMDNEYKEMIFSLSDRCKDLHNIAFIYSSIDEIDIRLAFTREDIVNLTPPQIASLINTFMQGIDVTNYNGMLNAEGKIRQLENVYPQGLDLFKTIGTPRVLKAILRDFYESWERIKGDICMEDILVLKTIKYAIPQLHDFIVNNINYLRSGLDNEDYIINKENNEISYTKRLLNSSVISLPKYAWINSFEEIVHDYLIFLFPEASKLLTDEKLDYRYTKRFQGVCFRKYWDRYILDSIYNEDIPDSQQIELLQSWKDNNGIKYQSISVIELLLNGKFDNDIIISYHIEYGSNDYLLLFKSLLCSLFNDDRNKTANNGLNSRNTPYCIEIIWLQYINAVQIIQSAIDNVFLEIIENYIEKDFLLTEELLYRVGAMNVDNNNDINKLKPKFQLMIESHFIGKPDKLYAAIEMNLDKYYIYNRILDAYLLGEERSFPSEKMDTISSLLETFIDTAYYNISVLPLFINLIVFRCIFKSKRNYNELNHLDDKFIELDDKFYILDWYRIKDFFGKHYFKLFDLFTNDHTKDFIDKCNNEYTKKQLQTIADFIHTVKEQN